MASESNSSNRFLPDIPGAWSERKRIKSIYRECIYELKNEERANIDFNSVDTSCLGDIIETRHFRTIGFIEEKGYKEEGDLYKLHRKEDREEFISRAKKIVWMIRFKNIISYVFWLAVALILLFIFSTITNISGPVFEQIFNKTNTILA